jgi:hypothetical protein
MRQAAPFLAPWVTLIADQQSRARTPTAIEAAMFRALEKASFDPKH